LIEFKRQATTARSFGLDMHLLGPHEVKSRWPILEAGDLIGATFVPSDGQASPSDLTQSLARGARMHGARIFEGVAVTGFDIVNGRVVGARTTAGDIRCEKVVNCAGQWARKVGALAGVSVPLQPMRHQYVITERITDLPSDMPTLRDPDRLTYFKEEVGGLAFGGYENDPRLWLDEPPDDFAYSLLEDDWDLFEQHLQNAVARVPSLETVGIKRMIAGPESFTPDGNFILGESPELTGFFVGAGFNSFGIASAGGAGWALAEWTMTGEPPLDLWSVDIRRFSSVHRDTQWVRERTLEAYAKHYAIAYPHEEMRSARPNLTSPLYLRLRDLNGCFGSKLGWERANWFAPEDVGPADHYAMGRQNWFDAVGQEHCAVRERVGLIDQSSFAKFELRGVDAERALTWICANDVTIPPGHIVYTQMLNSRGGIECDLTVSRLASDLYYIVTGTGFRTHDLSWIARHIPADAAVTLVDVTEKFGTLSLMGPRSREVLAAVSDSNIDNTTLGFARCQTLRVASRTVRVLRISYVGELGYELHVPTADLVGVFEALMEAGRPFGIAPVGYRAIESLRLEKAYRAWGSDITPNDNPFQAGLGWAVKLDTNQPFLGRSACEAVHSAPLGRRLMTFTVDDPNVVLIGRETILRDGIAVGYLTSGGWGYTVGTNIGLGYVRNETGVSDDFLLSGRYQLEVATELTSAVLHVRPLYDPDSQHLKA
jgi:4-methylaminobutanoate oxidase (formaldehyde-forming)